MPGSVTDGLEYWARLQPEEPAVIFRERKIGYRDLRDRARAVAVHLQDRGLSAGEVVGIVGNNSVEWCVGALGALLAGSVLATYNHRFVPDELAKLLSNSQPRYVLAGAEHVDRLRALLDRGWQFEIIELARIDDLVAPPDAESRLVAVQDRLRPEDPALIVYTSGTTNVPKGVIFTHQQVHATVLESVLMEGMVGTGSRRLCVLPMAIAGGIFYSLLHQLIRGGCVILEPDFHADAALKAVVEHRATWVSGPPIVFERLSEAEGFDRADLSCIKFALCGGARVPPALLRAWQAKGVLVRQLYGSTEAGGVATVASPDEAVRKPESCGQGGLLTRVRVVRPDGSECDAGEQGEFVISGPGCTPGYWRNEEATRELIVDGWLHTRDLGIRDEEGSLIFVDRMQELIISGGLNISPREIESVLVEYPDVVEACVFPVPDTRFGETPAAVIYGKDIDVPALITYCNERLADFKVPRYVEVVGDPLPRMPSGKLDKRGLKQTYQGMPETHPRVR
jgi:fatty-acyl-CoA synthase